MIEKIFHMENLIGSIIRAEYCKNGIEFITPDFFSQQLGYMNRPAGYQILPHVHNPVARKVIWTQDAV